VGFVVVLHVMVVHVMVLFVVVGAVALLFFEFLTTLACLFAVFAMALDRVAHFILCRVNTLFASRAPFVPIIGADW
jgi:hypothetical protein